MAKLLADGGLKLRLIAAKAEVKVERVLELLQEQFDAAITYSAESKGSEHFKGLIEASIKKSKPTSASSRISLAKNWLYGRKAIPIDIVLRVMSLICSENRDKVTQANISCEIDQFCRIFRIKRSDLAEKTGIPLPTIDAFVQNNGPLREIIGYYILCYPSLALKGTVNIYPLSIYADGAITRYKYTTASMEYSGFSLYVGNNIVFIGEALHASNCEIEMMVWEKHSFPTRDYCGVITGVDDRHNPVSTKCIATRIGISNELADETSADEYISIFRSNRNWPTSISQDNNGNLYSELSRLIIDNTPRHDILIADNTKQNFQLSGEIANYIDLDISSLSK